MNVNEENILVGEDLFGSISLISYGKKLYECMSKISPEEIIFVDAKSGKQTTYRNFLNLSCRLARSLHNSGYKPNDVISVSAENNEYYFVPVVASFFLGIISAPLNQTYTQRELAHMLNIIQPKVIFCAKKNLHSFVEQKRQFKCIERIIILDSEKGVDGFESMIEFIRKYCEEDFSWSKFNPVDVDPMNHVAAIMCSSGTTGLPKGVMVTHDNFSFRAHQLIDPRLHDPQREILCACLPFFHAYGFMMVATGIMKKCRFVIMQRFEEELFLEAIEKYKINTLHIVPPIAHFLARSPLPLKYDISSLLDVFIGAAPLSEDIESAIGQRFPFIRSLRQGYGMTEGTMALIVMPTGERRIGSSGKVVPGISVYVRDIETGRPLGPNQTGEPCFKGRGVTKGYYRNPEITKLTFVDGWLRSGDIGYYDEEGYFYIVDRLKELIKYKGFQVPPAELEGILLTHPKIKDVGVVGKPDDVAGELPTAFVVKNLGCELSENEVIEFVAGQVSKPKQLHGGVYFIDVIPKTASGKILRRALREMLTKQSAKL